MGFTDVPTMYLTPLSSQYLGTVVVVGSGGCVVVAIVVGTALECIIYT